MTFQILMHEKKNQVKYINSIVNVSQNISILFAVDYLYSADKVKNTVMCNSDDKKKAIL